MLINPTSRRGALLRPAGQRPAVQQTRKSALPRSSAGFPACCTADFQSAARPYADQRDFSPGRLLRPAGQRPAVQQTRKSALPRCSAGFPACCTADFQSAARPYADQLDFSPGALLRPAGQRPAVQQTRRTLIVKAGWSWTLQFSSPCRLRIGSQFFPWCPRCRRF